VVVTAAPCATRSRRRWCGRATATANGVSGEVVLRRRRRHILLRERSGSSRARKPCGSGSRPTAGRSGSAENADRRSTGRIPITPNRSESVWERSTMTLESVPPFDSSSPTPPVGSLCPTTVCRGSPKADTPPSDVSRRSAVPPSGRSARRGPVRTAPVRRGSLDSPIASLPESEARRRSGTPGRWSQ
jgi:hypothetical protein